MPLSSSLTFMIRMVLPAGWALLLPVALLIHVPDEFEPMRRFLIAGLAVLLLESAAWFVRLKDIYADANGLVISNGRVNARVSWDQVAGIRKTWWGKNLNPDRTRRPLRLGKRRPSTADLRVAEPAEILAKSELAAVVVHALRARRSRGPPWRRSSASSWRRSRS